jgi:hypothetical protein
MDFILDKKVDDSIVKQYNDLLPQKLLAFWKSFGFGSLANGYIKIINPNEYDDLLKSVYQSPIHKNSVPMMITGLGDIIIWENNYIILVNLRKGDSEVIESGFNYFFEDLSDEEFLEEDLENKNYSEVVQHSGTLSYHECYAYFPLLRMGGSEKLENLKKVEIKEYINIVSQSLGVI